MNSLKLIAALVLGSALVVFGVQNTQAVRFHILLFTVPSMPVVLALFGAALLGALLGWIVAAPGRFRQMRTRQGLQGQITAREQADATARDAAQSQAS